MNKKITIKLFLSFLISLIIFTLINSTIFTHLFRNHTIELTKQEMITQSNNISEDVKTFLENKTKGSGFRKYLQMINDVTNKTVWVVDENLNFIINNNGNHTKIEYEELPINAKELVEEVLKGKTTFSEEFSYLLDQPTLTVGTPITINNKIVGVVLLHSSISGINNANNATNKILLMSLSISLVLALFISSLLSKSFTKPLKIINDNTLKLAKGDYHIKNQINKKDEIGQLANSINYLSQQLAIADEEYKNKEERQKEFVANVSHELKTPVTIIKGSLEALNDHIITNPQEIQAYYKQMLYEINNLQDLIKDLLDLSQLENLEFSIFKQDISKKDLINDVIRTSKKIAANKNINIILNNNSENDILHADYTRIRQLLLIIIDNAIKFSPMNSYINININNNSIVIEDFGEGINKDQLPYIFDRFNKSTSSTNHSGNGLGLSIAKEIAKKHNYQITVESEINKGTKFIINTDN
ncbi:MAG: HAMP domain-containing sensor histidine kinase [Erysipelotrichaceae bacterium]